jgi:hypothetical protein
VTAYKFLSSGSVGPFSGFRWPTPEGGAPGPWVETAGELSLCRRGVHACRLSDLPYWLDDELWLVELDGRIQDDGHQIVAERARLVERLASWNRDTARALAEDCTWRARDLARSVLAGAGLVAEGDALGAAGSPAELEQVGVCAFDAALAAGNRRAARAADAAVEAARHLMTGAGRSDLTTYVAFTAYAAAVAADAAEPGGDERERARQAQWLAGRLGLAASNGG